LPLLVARLGSQLASLAAQYEAILVNDGSADQSLSAMHAAEQRYSWVRVFSLLRNYGQRNALLCGIRQARHEIIVTMDDDLQNPPEEIGKLLRKLDEGYDVVYGYSERDSHGLLRNVASRITKISLQRVMGVSAAAHVSSFRAFRTESATPLCSTRAHLSPSMCCLDGEQAVFRGAGSQSASRNRLFELLGC